MKKTIAILLCMLISFTSIATIAEAHPVLDLLTAYQTFNIPDTTLDTAVSEAVSTEFTSPEEVSTELEGMSLQLVDGELTVCCTYTAQSSTMEIEIQTFHPILGPSLPFGRAKIKASTKGHDTEGANIKHCCRFDGSASWSVSPLQPSPSWYTFRRELYGSGSRWVIVEGWITDSTGWIESNHDEVSVWVIFSL